MSAIEEVIAALQAVVDELNDTSNAAASATAKADDAMSQAVVLGATATVAGLSAVKESIEKLSQQVQGTLDIANDMITQAHAVADGT
ncbi:hypothetical protein [Actinoplanes siamensis]|uniref:Uncharacterized protein n=1 Tax=Actinoplanes siamensis TaxID=1223317 RepID=A0A919NDI9_9ACTN|nr:hypothetical protein [Actinoplanes siamensis]GIF09161.1 hypothetical protein Asi03nite_66990 [Actinoplanes siamensis]